MVGSFRVIVVTVLFFLGTVCLGKEKYGRFVFVGIESV